MFMFISCTAAAVILISMLKSKHFIKAILISCIQGAAALFAVNFAGDFIGVHIPMNIFSLSAGAVGGLPGVIYLLVCEILVTAL